MEKISLKPIAQEIVLKGSPQDGHMDIFAYDADSPESKLGNIYVVGNVVHATDDASYIINLIASLAKREYYAHAEMPIRDAFSNSLKKVNEVVGEFFKNKDLKLNLGIFAVAGEQILISKLGKFKIVLSRDDKNIDILNNIELFNKEHIQEKEFSNIISGKVKTGDKILAFYPNKSVTMREKTIKEQFLKLASTEFSEKINGIKKVKDDFGCAILCLNIEEHKENLSTPKIKEPMRPKARDPLPQEPASPAPTLAKSEAKPVSKPETKPIGQEVSEPIREEVPVVNPTPVPRIIPAEFALGKKKSILAPIGKYANMISRDQKIKAIFALGIAVLIIGAAVSAKIFFFQSPELKALEQKLTAAEEDLKVAKAKVSQNDFLSARKLLYGSLSSLANIDQESKKAVETKSEIIKALDGIENAQEITPALVYQIPSESGQASLLSSVNQSIYVYLGNSLVTLENKEQKSSTPVSLSGLSQIFSHPQYVSMVSPSGISTLKDGKINNYEVSTSSALDSDMYEGNLYMLSADGISKITDAATGGKTSAVWLTDASELIPSPLSILVDGKVYILNSSGTLATYYKGKKSSEVNTLLPVENDHLFLSAADSNYLYLVQKNLGRVYKIAKDSGTVEKTVKIDSMQPMIHATLGSNDILYFLTNDNKVWMITL